MDEQKPESQTLFPHETGHHHRSARERQRRGPMWGCLRTMFWLFALTAIFLFIIAGGGWWYLGTENFAGYVRTKVVATLEGRLERKVQIKSVVIQLPHRVILNDLRIANAPGSVNPYFATVQQVIITGGIQSFYRREVKVDRVDVIGARMNFEVFPEGSELTHNFPKWKTGPRRRFEIYRLQLGRMFVRQSFFQFLDRRRNITAEAIDISSDVSITSRENLYEGIMRSPRLRVTLQDYVPFDLDMRGGFRYTPGVLALNSIALRGNGIEAYLAGRLDPLTEGAYNLRLRSGMELERIAEIFRIDKTLRGHIALDTALRGKQGDFHLTGGWVSPRIVADTYELADAEGKLDVNGRRTVVDVEKATYGGGRIGAHYTLTQYAEPYPMNVELRYDRISIEQLFSDWGVEGTGLRGAATGALTYQWNKDRVLDGSGRGNAQLARNTVAFSNAKYPIEVAGSTDFTLNRGVVSFARAELDTDKSHVSLNGSLRIEDINTDLDVRIRSSDFSELDRIAYNFARAADKDDYELLGLAGSGQISGTVRGPIKTPVVEATAIGSAVRYNDVLLGSADLALRYDGRSSTLTFNRAIFADGVGRLSLTGSIRFPDRGPSPVFDIAVDATNYPVDRAIAAVGLDFKVGPGRGTGKLLVSGTPEQGRVTFAGMTIYRGDATLKLTGDVNWLPGEGNVRFDLGIDAANFPITDIITFLDLGDLPVTGDLTGQLHLEGPKSALGGTGAVTIRQGTIYGEPIDVASANITFTEGRLRATNVAVTAPAGQITGEAEFDLNTERFSYNITSSSLDLSRFKLLESIRGLLGGNITITSTGAGTLEQPELVLEARLNQATIQGLALPPDAPPPSIYIAIRGGRLIVKGSIADIVTIDGEGSVGEQMEVDGLVRVTVSDLARALALMPAAATVPASGNMVVDLRLGGRLTPIDQLRIEGTVPTFNLRVSDHDFVPRQPIAFALRDGRVVIQSFELAHEEALLAITGFAEIVGEKRLNIDVRGRVEAALLQLFMTDVRADGEVALAMSMRGTMAVPTVTGTAELQDAEVRFAGFPQTIDDISGTLRFRGDSIEVDAVRATVGGGAIVAGGEIALAGIRPVGATLSIVGTGVTLRYFEGVTLEGNFDLRLTGDLERSMLQGEVNVTRALYFKDFDLQQAVLNAVISRGGVVPVTAAEWQNRVSLRIQLTAPDTLAVENNIAKVTGSAELDVAGTLGNPVILGSVELDEGGTVTFQNIDYRLVRGTISFQNPFRIDPYFDVTLEGNVSGGVSAELEDSGPIELTLNITGTLDRLGTSISSDPPASDITLFSLLGFGALTRPGETTASAGTVGQSLVLSTLISNLGSRILPFADSFSYDPGLLDTTTGAAEPKVTFEKRVSDDVQLLIVYNMNSHESREVVEWLVNRDWTAQLTRDGLKREYRLDARFRRRYEGRWTWGDRGRQNGETVFPVGRVSDVVTPEAVPAVTTTDVAALAPDTVVSEIRFRADGGFDTTTLREYLTFAEGVVLSRRALQETTKALYATGNFRDIRIDAQASDAGAIITLTLSLNYRIDQITYEGANGANRTRAQREVTIRRGDVLSLNAIDDSARAIQEELREAGYLEATVDPETRFRREENRADVIFSVNAGPVAKVSTVELEGDLDPFTYQELLERIREKPGATFKLSDARRDAERIRSYVARKDYRRANVELAGHTYDDATDTVALRYTVEVGPKVRVDVAGVDRSDVRRQLPFSGDEGYSDDEVEKASEDMRLAYQRRGFFDATVDTESRFERDLNLWVTTFTVTPGQRFKLTDVEFAGNIKVPDDDLEGIIETSPRGGFRRVLATLLRRPTGVTQQQLNDDRDAIESYYRLNGFQSATVATPVAQTNPDGTLVVTFPITEGAQTVLSQVNVEGVEQVDAGDLPDLKLEEGKPLNKQLLAEDIVALQTFYSNRGNAEVQVKERIQESADKSSAKLDYVISEGPRIKVGEVVVQGNTYTDSDVVLRKVGLDEGEPFTYTSILEAQRELYRLGIFSRADVQAQQAGTSVADRNVTISVEEGRNLAVSGSIGIRADTRETADRDFSYRVAAGIAHRNLFGTGRYFGVQAVGTQGGAKEQELFITYREPFIGRRNIPVQLTIFQTDDETRRETRLLQRGVSIEAAQVSRYRTRWSVLYQYKIAECIEGLLCDQQNVISPGGDRSFLNVQISSITPTFFWDKRDDVVDPHRGFFTSASVEYAFPLFSARSNFLKEFVQGAWYFPVSRRSVLAVSGRAGWVQPIRNTPTPLSERFTAGGDTTHRAFPLDLLGTLCAENVSGIVPDVPGCSPSLFDVDSDAGEISLVPLGGNSVFVANAEYRFPIVSNVGGAVFADIGNVFAESQIDFGDLRYGVGAGVRYLSFVGPLRLDVGFPLNKRDYERSFNWFITIGYAF